MAFIESIPEAEEIVAVVMGRYPKKIPTSAAAPLKRKFLSAIGS